MIKIAIMASSNILRCVAISPLLVSNYVRLNRHSSFRLIIKAVPSLTSDQYTSHNQFSTIFNIRQPKSTYLPAFSNTLCSKSLLSTHIDSDKYNVVVTDPSTTSDLSANIAQSLEASSAASSAANATIAAADTAVPVTTELAETAAQLAEPTLASLGLCNWTPVGAVQMFLEYLHVGWDMPWWVAIAASTVVARIFMLPLLIKTQKNAIHMGNYMPQMQYLQAKFGEARKTGNTMEATRHATELMEFMKEQKVSPVKNAMMPMLQAPVFISFFMALRSMAKTPVESMQTGGLFWATDLTIPDPYYITPVIACGTLYIVLKLGAESGVRLENMKMARYVMQALPLVALPFCINFPAAVLYYWVTTNFCTLGFVAIMKIEAVRKLLKMPMRQQVDPMFKQPKKPFIKGIRDSFEDQKVLSAIDERRRTDEMRFLKAGTGPVPRTYSYDPTKPRPSNAAVSAKQHQS